MNMQSQQPPENERFAASGQEPTEEEEGTSLRNYWLMIMERKWYALSVLCAIFLAAAIYTFTATPIFESTATVEILKHGPQVMRVVDVVESSITSDTDFNTQIKLLESLSLAQSVVNRLTSDEVSAVTEPYSHHSESANPLSIIFRNRRIMPQRMTLMLAIQFRHPNPKVAARIVNLYAEEYIANNARQRAEESMKAVDELKDRADQQRKRVDELANSLQAFRQRGNLISLVQSKDIVTDRLKSLNMMATQTHSKLKDAEVRWNQVLEWQKEGKDLTELSFVAIEPKVSQLLQQITTQKITLAQLRERYKDKHPRLIEVTNTLSQAEREMKLAIDNAAATVKADYDNAQKTDEEARKALADQEARSLDLDKSGVEYDNLNREFRVNEQLLESMLIRMRETSVNSTIETQNARIIDRGGESQIPVSPKIFVNLVLGLLGGLFCGLGVAYLIALVDDRIKNSFDIESLVGLPLIGVIPQVQRMDQPDKAQIVSNGADRMIVEAFLSLFSSLRISEESRNARLILVTSTMPGEGKSFIASNLALAFASQGQRTAIVDCDLRKPNVHKSFRLGTGKGVINYCTQGLSLDDVVVRNVHPNLDVITSGGKARNPTLLLNSKEFETLVGELNKRYDRVLFDTPPLGAVSDALNLLPLMDGALYTIYHNRVRRRAARRCVQRLKAANIPIFGAVLNGISARLTGDYYGEYRDKSYQEYYEINIDEAGTPNHLKPAGKPRRSEAAEAESTT